MGWHMKLVICVQLAYVSVCLTREMSVVREWTSLDVLTSEDGQESRRSIMPSKIYSWLLYKDRLFVTLSGQPYSLAYLDLTDNSKSPLLRPYPSYEDQEIIYYTAKVRVDRCDRLWVLSNKKYPFRKQITVFDLKTGSILRNSSYPDGMFSIDMIFDDSDCDNEYVYISNHNGVWTYSWAEGDSWHRDMLSPMAWMLLAPNSIVYFNLNDHISRVFYMPTTRFKDKRDTSVITDFDRNWNLNVNLALSASDAKSDVLYYFNNDNRIVIHAAPCWTSERCSTNSPDDIDVGFDPTHELRYITLDENGYLWAVTRKSSFEDGKINFRLLSVLVKSTDAKSNAKDTTNTSTGVESNTKDTTNTSTGVESNTKDTTNTSTDVKPNAKDITNTTNINESTTAASSATEQTSTLGHVPKHTTVNIAVSTAGTPNSDITQAVGGTNMPYLLTLYLIPTILIALLIV